MTKALIVAIFLSQVLIHPLTTEDTYGSPVYPRRINSIHIYSAINGTVVVTPDDWYTQKAPVPYWFFWSCNFEGQTAQQCIAIHSMLDEELRK